MPLLLIFTASSGLVLTWRFRGNIDERLGDVFAKVSHQVKRFTGGNETTLPDLVLVSRIVAGMRSGASLDAVLGDLARDTVTGERNAKIHAIVTFTPKRDFLSEFLADALRSGVPVLQSLISLQKSLAAVNKMRLRVRALSAQARAQAEALSLLPLFFVLGFVVVDAGALAAAKNESISWLLFGVSLLLIGFGRLWIKHVLDKALKPPGLKEAITEETLPELALSIIAWISSGMDGLSAYERALARVANPSHRRTLLGADAGAEFTQLSTLVLQSSRSGAPLRDDLGQFLFDLHSLIEARWEERAQRVPIRILAPLFCCFFPAALLAIGALLIPMVSVSP